MTTTLFASRHRCAAALAPRPAYVAPAVAAAGAVDDLQLLAQTLEDYRSRMLAVARRFFDCEVDCVDAVQDAYVAALRHLPSFRQEAQLGTWLHRIVVNACRMKLRSRSRRPALSLEDAEPASLDEPGVEALSREELRRGVREALQKLPSAARTVIQLRDLEGFSTSEAAAILGVSSDVVKTRLHRARQELRRFVSEAWLDEGSDE